MRNLPINTADKKTLLSTREGRFVKHQKFCMAKSKPVHMVLHSLKLTAKTFEKSWSGEDSVVLGFGLFSGANSLIFEASQVVDFDVQEGTMLKSKP